MTPETAVWLIVNQYYSRDRRIRHILEWLALDDTQGLLESDPEPEALYESFRDYKADVVAVEMFHELFGNIKPDQRVFPLFDWLKNGMWEPDQDDVEALVDEYVEAFPEVCREEENN